MRYKVLLYDPQGRLVEKTVHGRYLGQAIPKNPTLKRRNGDYQPQPLVPDSPTFLKPLTLRDYFIIKAAGKFNLELEVRLVRQLSPKNVEGLVLPPVRIDIDVSENDSYNN